jgi:predicted permease
MNRWGEFLWRKASELRSWMRAVTHRRGLEDEMQAEFAEHLAQLTEDLIRAGHEPAEAARRARIAMGPMLMHKEEVRASLGLRWFDELGADLRYAARLLRKSPGFTAIAVTSLALAIGANTAIFSIAKQLLYDRLNVPHAAELRLFTWVGPKGHVAVHHTWGNWDPLPGGLVTSASFSYPVYLQLRAQNRSLGDLFAFKETGMNATILSTAQRVRVAMVSGNYYAQLEVRPQLGRAIQSSDDVVGQAAVAVISDGLWERVFGRSPAVLGQTIKINDAPVVIVGVNPKGFTGAGSVQSVQESPDVFVPLSAQPLVDPIEGKPLLADAEHWWLNVMGRARPGGRDSAAQAVLNGQLAAIVRGTMPVRKGEDLPRLALLDGSRGLFAQERSGLGRPIAVLMTLVGLVLLLACANVANLLLARGAQRLREMSVRMALGAGRVRILRQMLAESLLLAVMGGAGGLIAGYFGSIGIIPRLVGNAWEQGSFQVHFDWPIFGFAAAITILTGLLFGLAPALVAARGDVTHGLKETSQTTSRRRKGLSGKALVGFQIALSTLLVIGAGLFLRTLAELNSIDVGFRTDHMLLAEVNPPESKYPAGQDVLLHERIEEAFAAVPGVESVTAAALPYVSGDLNATDFLLEGEAYDREKHQEEDYNFVGRSFFETMGIPIVAGRGFGVQDTETSTKVAVINEALAKSRFPGRNPIGMRFSAGGHNSDGHKAAEDSYQIVGICGDTHYNSLREDPPPQFILFYPQLSSVGGMTYEIRTHMRPEAIAPALHSALRRIDPDLPLVDVRTQEQQIDEDMQQERMFVALTSGFGLLALALASVGIYGIMAYSVVQRTNEIGIRLALGALPGQIRGMVLRESTWITVAGLIAGLAGALMLVRLVKSMLYGIVPYDPVTLLAAVLLLLGVALVASWIPARRAAGVQPMDALRHE